MGQATLADRSAGDLPEPNSAIGSDALASADDLLAQLAGEEIDRLLAESDAEAEVENATHDEAEGGESVEQPTDAAATGIDSVLDSTATAAQPKGTLLEAEFATRPPGGTELKPEAPQPVTASPVTAPAPGPLPEIATATEEMRELLDVAPADSETGLEVPPPLYVRLLMLLDAPFAALPTAARETAGKVAILTLFNSVAVLLYVLIFRRHH